MTQTRYRNTLTVLTPEADWPALNELAVQLGESGESNRRTFTTVRYTRNGAGYAYANTTITDNAVAAILAAPAPVGALIVTALDPDNLPAYSDGTLIGINVSGLVEAFGFTAIEE